MLSVFRNVVHFCLLILYLMTLLNSLVSSRRFFIDSWGIFTEKGIFISSINIVLFLPFQNICRLFLVFAFFQWAELPDLCRIRVMRIDIIVLFLILEGEFLY